MTNSYEDEEDVVLRGGGNRVMLNNANGGQNGGMELNMGFFEYITTISSNEKAQILNMLQYGGLAILPLLIILKLMKMYVPEEDPFKGTPEIVIEVLLQISFILIAFFFIHLSRDLTERFPSSRSTISNAYPAYPSSWLRIVIPNYITFTI